MIKKLLAALLRFVHEQGYLLQLADYLERPADIELPVGGNHGENTPQ